MWIYDQESLEFLAVNRAAIAHYGYSEAEFLSMTIEDIRPAEDVPSLLDRLQHKPSGYIASGIRRHLKKMAQSLPWILPPMTLSLRDGGPSDPRQ